MSATVSLKFRVASNRLFGVLVKHQVEQISEGQVHCSRCIGADSSPSSTGVEILAGRMSTIFNADMSTKEEEQLPFLSQASGYLDVASKVLAMLWYIFLRFGPSEANMRVALWTFRWWISDWGVESNIPNAPDYLPTFLDIVANRVPRAPQPGSSGRVRMVGSEKLVTTI